MICLVVSHLFFWNNFIRQKMMGSRKILTLAIIRNAANILLGMKKRGFGQGKWNGFGGKVEPGETIHDAAIREIEEECGLKTKNLGKVGVLVFEFEGDPILMEVHVFVTSKYVGEPIETEEMRPQWFPIENIPYNKMWLDNHIWFPHLLAGQKFEGYFLYQDHTIVKQSLVLLD